MFSNPTCSEEVRFAFPYQQEGPKLKLTRNDPEEVC